MSHRELCKSPALSWPLGHLGYWKKSVRRNPGDKSRKQRSRPGWHMTRRSPAFLWVYVGSSWNKATHTHTYTHFSFGVPNVPNVTLETVGSESSWRKQVFTSSLFPQRQPHEPLSLPCEKWRFQKSRIGSPGNTKPEDKPKVLQTINHPSARLRKVKSL